MAANRLCSIPGCGKKHLARGFCRRHYGRLQAHGDPEGGATFVGEPMRFYLEALQYTGEDCLFWPFGKIPDGYGVMRLDGKPQLVHRLVCKHSYGPPPSRRHEAAHSCGNGHRGCVAKGHLRWALPKENAADKNAHGTHLRGTQAVNSKLDERAVASIRARLRTGESTRSIASDYGVARETVRQIGHGKRWGWLP